MAVQRQVGSQTDAKESAVDLTGKEFHFIARAADGRFTLPLAGGKAAGVCQEGKAAGRHSSIATGNQLKVVAVEAIAPGDEIATDVAGKAVVAGAGDEILGEALSVAAAGELAEIEFHPKGLAV